MNDRPILLTRGIPFNGDLVDCFIVILEKFVFLAKSFDPNKTFPSLRSGQARITLLFDSTEGLEQLIHLLASDE